LGGNGYGPTNLLAKYKAALVSRRHDIYFLEVVGTSHRRTFPGILILISSQSISIGMA